MFDDRNIALYKDKFDKIKKLNVAIVGLGGVGSIIPLSLVRVGVKSLIIVDKDKVEESNLNRQLAYDKNDIGQYKAEVLAKKLTDLRDDLSLTYRISRVDKMFNFSIFKNVDYIIDCIDDIEGKKELIKYALNNHKKIIISCGMGKRFFPSKVTITTLNKTYNDPLAKKLRYELRKEEINIDRLPCCFSFELASDSNPYLIASSVFVPNSAGLLMASFVINDYLSIR